MKTHGFESKIIPLFLEKRMKKSLFFIACAIGIIMVRPLMAGSVTLNWGNGQTITVDGIDDDLVHLVNDHKTEIETALTDNNVTQAEAEDAVAQAKKAYEDYTGSNSGSVSGTEIIAPYTTTIHGLQKFTDVIVDVLPNTQIQQNVWANAWIGQILPKPNLGFGMNAGVSKLDLSPLIDVAEALGMSDSDDLPSTLVWPTVTVDVRLGGFILPFDVGFTAMSFDSSTVSSLGSAIDPAYFDFFMIGGDVRYAIFKGGMLRPKLSVGLGVYHTKGDFGVEEDGSSAELDFSSTSLVLSTQASIKLLFFVPFAGARVMFSNSDVNWKVKANWSSILDSNDTAIQKALEYNILPSHFSGNSSSSFVDHVRPVLFGGFAIDLFILDITVSGSYDFVSQIPSAAVSVRLALN